MEVEKTDDWLEIPVGKQGTEKTGTQIERIGDNKFDNPDGATAGEPEPPDTADDQGDEHDQYSESVKRRIASLTRKFREAERQRDAAAEYARQVQAERDQFRNQAQQYGTGYVTQHAKSVERDIADTKRSLSEAMEKNDNAALVEAQTRLTELMWEQQRIKQTPRPQPQQYAAQQYAAQQYARPQQQLPQPDAKATKWAEENSWFGTDRVLTQTALAVHQQLIEEEGFDPQTDDYYNELNARMSKYTGGQKRNGPAVAGVSRSAKPGGAKKVKLTKSQVEMANRLGVPLEEYAKYVR